MGHWFFLGAGFSLWFTWQVSTAFGIFLGTAIPESWSLDFALPLTFIAMVVLVLKNRPAIAAALSAGVVALLAYSLSAGTDSCCSGWDCSWNIFGEEPG